MSITVSILQSNYIPWKGYFDLINMSDVFVIYDDMQYTKRDWRNRNKIKTPNGLNWLTIPVQVKGKFSQKINETIISDSHWGDKHWRTITHNYNKAKHFSLVSEYFSDLFLEKSLNKLSEVNHAFLLRINEFLGIKTRVLKSTDFSLKDGKSEKLLGICQDLNATNYLSGPAAKDYIDLEIFKKNRIGVEWMDYTGYPEYGQLHPPFNHFVSILDLLFSEGKLSSKFMKSFK